jgi:hypothetical protein
MQGKCQRQTTSTTTRVKSHFNLREEGKKVFTSGLRNHASHKHLSIKAGLKAWASRIARESIIHTTEICGLGKQVRLAVMREQELYHGWIV